MEKASVDVEHSKWGKYGVDEKVRPPIKSTGRLEAERHNMETREMCKATTLIMIAFGLVLASPAALSQWPERPVQLIVPFPAGGLVDAVARKFAEPLSRQLGKTVVVMNRAGASGIIGTASVATSTDGHTIGLVTNGPLVIQPLLRSRTTYKTNDLQPICQVFSYTFVLAVRTNSPYNSLKEFIQAAKERDTISLAYLGPGAAQHFVMLQLSQATGAKFIDVPYSGDSPIVLALKSGSVDAAILADEVASPQGFKVLAVASDRRHPSFPDVPTMKEQGVDVAATTYAGLVTPATMSLDASRRLESACASVMRSAEFQESLRRMSIGADYLDRQQFQSKVSGDVGVKQQLIRSSGLKID